MAGTQSIERAIQLLRIIASRGRTGWVLSDLALVSGINLKTAHRILATLVDSRLVERHPVNRHYRPGPLLFELSLGRLDAFARRSAFEQAVQRLARRTGALSFAFVPSDGDVVVAAVAGKVPPGGVPVEIGIRRAMVLTAGGIAILMAMPPAAASRLVAANMAAVRKAGTYSMASVRRLIERSREAGYGISEGDIVRGMLSVALPVRDAAGVPLAALCVAGPLERFPKERVDDVLRHLRAEVAAVEAIEAAPPSAAG